MDLFLAGNRTKEKIMYMIECVAKKKSDKTLIKGIQRYYMSNKNN